MDAGLSAIFPPSISTLLDQSRGQPFLGANHSTIFLLLILSGFFSISETSMMALNRHRLKYLASQGSLGAHHARTAAKTDQLLSVIMIGNNNLIIIPVLTTSIALRTFGHDNMVLSITRASSRF